MNTPSGPSSPPLNSIDKRYREIAESVWTCAPIPYVSDVAIRDWRVYDVLKPGAVSPANATRHTFGYDTARCSTHVSSALLTFDPTVGYLVCSSGRIYELVGPPGPEAPAPAWLSWMRINALVDSDVVDVTDAVHLLIGSQNAK
jgi:hypothetical protein